jgi:alpha 1,2-mannosyltransferase
MMVPEEMSTIPTLFSTTKEFVSSNPDIKPKNMFKMFTTDGSSTPSHNTDYNGVHFWSNFEIGSLAFFRGPEYTKYFDYLDRAGGFFYERWGDAPVHSLAVGLFLDKSEVHYFGGMSVIF